MPIPKPSPPSSVYEWLLVLWCLCVAINIAVLLSK